VLAVFAVIVPLAYAPQLFPVPAFCKYICPAGTLEGAVGLLSNPVNADKFSMLNILFTRKFIILITIATLSVFLYRFFCRFICPLGALYSFFSRIALLGVRVDGSSCTGCEKCVTACKMDVHRVGDRECIHCGQCIGICPSKAISWKGKQIFLSRNATPASKDAHAAANTGVTENSPGVIGFQSSRTKRAIGWGLALMFLCVVLWQANRPAATASPSNASAALPTIAVSEAESSPEKQATNALGSTESPQPPDNTTPLGNDVGMRAVDFSADVYGGGTFRLSENRGRVVVLNFWATWCTPCVHELPYFQHLWEAYGDRAAVIAIHSSLVTDDVEAFLAQEGYTMPFALDEDGSIIENLGGSTMLPMTVIIDADGIITYNKVGSVTYEFLDAEIKQLLHQ
jgi:thiol-disulfide isomerase/thioredoxin/ferredoxin